MSVEMVRRRRLVAVGVVAVMVVALVVAVIAIAGGGDDGSAKPPASAAARLVPADALVYVHLSTDPDRSQTRDAAKVASSFPSWRTLRDGIVSRLQAPGCDVATKA